MLLASIRLQEPRGGAGRRPSIRRASRSSSFASSMIILRALLRFQAAIVSVCRICAGPATSVRIGSGSGSHLKVKTVPWFRYGSPASKGLLCPRRVCHGAEVLRRTTTTLSTFSSTALLGIPLTWPTCLPPAASVNESTSQSGLGRSYALDFKAHMTSAPPAIRTRLSRQTRHWIHPRPGKTPLERD
jgi:hypothetical protein